MKIIINETGVVKSLHYIDTETGVDSVRDIIGNAGVIGSDFIWDDEADAYRADQETYDWWETYLENALADAEELKSLYETYAREDIEAIIIEEKAGVHTDMDCEHDEWQDIFARIRNECTPIEE